MVDNPEVRRSVQRTVKTVVTLTQEQYEPILCSAVGAPNTARVEIENSYGGDITITWEETTHEGGD